MKKQVKKLSLMSRPGLMGRVLLIMAALVSLYLASIALTQTSVVGCAEDSGCYSVLESRWSTLFGIPASFPAIAVYLVAVLAAGAFESREHRTWLGLAGEVTVLLIAVAAVWYLSLQFVAIGKFCPWCCLIHVFALGGVFFLVWSRRLQPGPDQLDNNWAEAAMLRRSGLMTTARAIAVLLGLVTLGVGPFIGSPRKNLHIAKSEVPQQLIMDGAPVLSYSNGNILLRPTDLPLLGKSSAKQFAVALVDYTCDYCRLYHATMEELVAARGDNFAIALLPAARDDNSRQIQQVMLCLFRADPEKHHTLATQLLSGTHAANGQAARLSAIAPMGEKEWADAERLHSTWAAEQIELTRKLMAVNQAVAKSTRLPQLMAGSEVLVGYYDDAAKINAFLDNGFKSTPSEPAAAPDETEPVVAATDTTVAPNTPQLRLKQNFLDMGRIEKGQKRLCHVEFTNSGTAPLKLAWIGLSEGCELVRMPQESISEGASGTILINVTAPSDADIFQRRIEINSNAAKPTVVNVQGHVVPVNSAKPATTEEPKATALLE